MAINASWMFDRIFMFQRVWSECTNPRADQEQSGPRRPLRTVPLVYPMVCTECSGLHEPIENVEFAAHKHPARGGNSTGTTAVVQRIPLVTNGSKLIEGCGMRLVLDGEQPERP
jgi:hypothetical protein